jgi:hypothetical protein
VHRAFWVPGQLRFSMLEMVYLVHFVEIRVCTLVILLFPEQRLYFNKEFIRESNKTPGAD